MLSLNIQIVTNLDEKNKVFIWKKQHFDLKTQNGDKFRRKEQSFDLKKATFWQISTLKPKCWAYKSKLWQI